LVLGSPLERRSLRARPQGSLVERIGYPGTLVVDSVVGLLGLALLPLMRPKQAPAHAIATTAAAAAAATK
jgi:hypothetical protein